MSGFSYLHLPDHPWYSDTPLNSFFSDDDGMHTHPNLSSPPDTLGQNYDYIPVSEYGTQFVITTPGVTSSTTSAQDFSYIPIPKFWYQDIPLDPYLYASDINNVCVPHSDHGNSMNDTTNVSDTSTPLGCVGGDPYIFPKHGPCIKLPNCHNTYRLLQIPSLDMIVNAEVSETTRTQTHAIQRQFSEWSDTYGGVVVTGFFVTKVFVRMGPTSATFDLTHGPSVLRRDDLPWKDHTVHFGQRHSGLLKGPYVGRYIQVGPLTLEVCIHQNKQVRNELSFRLSVDCPSDTSGLLYRNYRPNLFQVQKLTDCSTKRRHLKTKRPFTRKIVHERTLEVPMSVM